MAGAPQTPANWQDFRGDFSDALVLDGCPQLESIVENTTGTGAGVTQTTFQVAPGGSPLKLSM